MDPESGGLSRILIEGSEETFLGRNPTAQITDISLSRKQASVCFDAGAKKWKFKTNRLCFHKKAKESDWQEVTDEVTLSNGDNISLSKDKYIYRCKVVGDSDEESDVPASNVVESDKPKTSSPIKNERILPAWMLNLDDNNSESPKKDSKTVTKQVI